MAFVFLASMMHMSSEYESVYYYLLLYYCVNLDSPTNSAAKFLRLWSLQLLQRIALKLWPRTSKKRPGAAERRDQTRSEYESR